MLLRRLTVADLAGTLEVAETAPLRYPAGGEARLHLRIRNDSAAMWPVFSDYGFLQCSVGYLWRQGGRVLDNPAGGLSLPRNLGPGESMAFAAPIQLPSAPGSYELQLIVVQVLAGDRGIPGNAELRVPVEIVRKAR